MSDLPGVNEFLSSGGGTPWCKFPAVGASITGTIISQPVAQHVRDYEDPSKLSYDDDGKPKIEIVVKLATDDRRPDIEDDDGTRALHIISPYMRAAVWDALRAANVPALEIGGKLTVTHTGLKGRSKLYTASYAPSPDSNAATSDGNNSVTAPVSNGAAAAGVADTSVQAPLCPANVDPAKWAQMDSTQQGAVLAALQSVGGTPPF